VLRSSIQTKAIKTYLIHKQVNIYHSLAAFVTTLAGLLVACPNAEAANDTAYNPDLNSKTNRFGMLPESDVTYSLRRVAEVTPEQAKAYERITASMDKAVWYYNHYTYGLHEQVNVVYSPGTPTADASYHGTIRFGGSCGVRVALHELAHTVGIGTTPQWHKMVVNHVFTGENATRQLRAISGNPNAQLHADRQHFWPYGLNYDKEVHSTYDYINHCKMVNAICMDLKSGS
jgi:hypothetical protein